MLKFIVEKLELKEDLLRANLSNSKNDSHCWLAGLLAGCLASPLRKLNSALAGQLASQLAN